MDNISDFLLHKLEIKDFNENLNIPKINLDELYVLNKIYNIRTWKDVKNKIFKLNNHITILRILKYSWISLYEKWYLEIENIIFSYFRYFDLINKKYNKNNYKTFFYNLNKKIINSNKINKYNINDFILSKNI